MWPEYSVSVSECHSDEQAGDCGWPGPRPQQVFEALLDDLMWTPAARAQHSRMGLRYGSDLTAAGWTVLHPFLPSEAGCRRKRAWREASPTAAVMDSQSVETTESGGVRGYDAGKKIKGRKRHALVDTDGRALKLQAHAADIRDRDGAGPLLRASRPGWPLVQLAFDAGCQGPHAAAANAIRVETARQTRRAGRLRRSCPALGRGALLRLDQPQPPLGQGLRGGHSFGPNLPPPSLRYPAAAQAGTLMNRSETDS